MQHLISHDKALQLMLAGKATFTIKNSDTGNRFTYKIERKRTKSIADQSNPLNALRFIKVLTGSNNETDYTYFAFIRILNAIDFDGNQGFEYKFASKQHNINQAAQSVRAFEWTVKCLRANVLPSFIEIWHEGKCMKCGRKLTDPASIEAGVGPECQRMVSKKR